MKSLSSVRAHGAGVPPGCSSDTRMSCSGSPYGNGRSKTPWKIENMAVFAPMPSPSVSSTAALNALRSDIIRIACRMSCHTDSIVGPPDDLAVNVRTAFMSSCVRTCVL